MSFMDRGMPLRMAMALMAIAFALALSACGDDDDGGDAGAPSADSAQTPPDGSNANAADGGAAPDGGANGGSANASSGDTEPINLKQAKLSAAELQRLGEMAPTPTPYTRYGFDRGSVRDRNAIMGMFRRMQREFFSGQFMAFCQKFGTGLYTLPQLKSGSGEDRIKECAAVISRMAKRLATGELDWPPHAVEWVRLYRDPGKEPYGGVTVGGPGNQIRVSFIEKNGRWIPEFSVPKDMKAINAR